MRFASALSGEPVRRTLVRCANVETKFPAGSSNWVLPRARDTHAFAQQATRELRDLRRTDGMRSMRVAHGKGERRSIWSFPSVPLRMFGADTMGGAQSPGPQ